MRDTSPRRSLLASLIFAGLLTWGLPQAALADGPPTRPQIEEGWELPQDVRERLESGTGSRLEADPRGALPVPEATRPQEPAPGADPSRAKATAPPERPSSKEGQLRRRQTEPWCWKGIP